MSYLAPRDRHLSISMHVEVPDRAHPGGDGRVLLTTDARAHLGAAGRLGLPTAQGSRRPGAAPAALARGVPRRRGGVRLRPERRLRAEPADDQPPPQGAARVGPARPQQTRGLGLLPRAPRGARRAGRAARRVADLMDLRTPLAELVGTAFLVAAVVGSGVAATRMSPDQPGLQLLENSLVTGAALVALILALRPVSASFNPVVTLVEAATGALAWRRAGVLVVAQLGGGLVGVVVANLMFGLPAVSAASRVREGPGLWLGEVVATLGLVLVVFGALRSGRGDSVAYAVAGWITAAYWFTSSTSFANPAVTVARALSDSFAGIAWSSVPAFVLAQLAGGAVG